MKRNIFLKIGAVLMTAICLVGFSHPVYAYGFPWTTVGSTGTVDEADLDIFRVSSGMAYLYTTAAADTLHIRYNIVAVEDLGDGGPIDLTVRFRDNGDGARVILKLKKYNIENGTTQVLKTFDSNDYTSSNGYQAQSDVECSPGWSFDFNNNAYYIDAEIKKTNVNGNPGLAIIQLSSTLC